MQFLYNCCEIETITSCLCTQLTKPEHPTTLVRLTKHVASSHLLIFDVVIRRRNPGPQRGFSSHRGPKEWGCSVYH